MAHYVRFEIYIPVVYVAFEVSSPTSPPRRVRHAMDELLISDFIAETIAKYKGVTQSHPTSPTPYKGWWKERADSPVDVDHLTYLFGLVRVDEDDEARKFFTSWKTRIEGAESQKYVLVIFYPVQTIGEFF
jgi:hypothetical protein